MSMTTDQLFIKLPTYLQWEILTDFVGTHVVRNGRLKRKMTGEIQEELARNMTGVFLWIKQLPLYIPLGTWIAYNGICFNTNVVVRRDFNMDIYLWEMGDTREITYLYCRYNYCSNSYRYTMKSGPSLRPFIKHDYPSYPYTDIKLGRSSKKMLLYNPRKCFEKRK